jgi:hypothetical protein
MPTRAIIAMSALLGCMFAGAPPTETAHVGPFLVGVIIIYALAPREKK